MVVSVKVPERLKRKMVTLKVKWSDVLRRAIENEILEHERRTAVDELLQFTKKHMQKNKSGKPVEAFVKETRAER